jgi:hypothetical protein
LQIGANKKQKPREGKEKTKGNQQEGCSNQRPALMHLFKKNDQ